MSFYNKYTTYLAVLSSGPVPDSPLKICLGVSLDEGVDGAHTAVSLGGVVGGGFMVSRGRGCVWRWNIPPHSSLNWLFSLSLKYEHVLHVCIVICLCFYTFPY